MTWVIGVSYSPPTATIIADVRMTVTRLADGAQLFVDNLLKIRAISSRLQVAFAGDVELGFRLTEALFEKVGHMHESDVLIDVHGFAELASRTLQKARLEMPERHADVLVAGLFSDQRVPANPQAYCLRFHGPAYEPVPPEPGKVYSIGSGATWRVAAGLQANFDKLLNLDASIAPTDQSRRSFWFQPSGAMIAILLEGNPSLTVSPAFVQGIVDPCFNIIEPITTTFPDRVIRPPLRPFERWSQIEHFLRASRFEDGEPVTAANATLLA